MFLRTKCIIVQCFGKCKHFFKIFSNFFIFRIYIYISGNSDDIIPVESGRKRIGEVKRYVSIHGEIYCGKCDGYDWGHP